MTFHGLLTALVTPFRDGALDEAAFRQLVRRQVDGGVDGLVPCGTTGEAPTLSSADQARVIAWTVEEAAGRVPVLAGIGSNDTSKAIAAAKQAAELGAQGVLATAPYYNKPTQEGLYRHFRAIADATPLEVCLYDVPGRTGVRILPPTVERLAPVANITAVKDATADLANTTDLLRRCGDQLTLLSGDDFTTLAFIAVGGSGCISVASNIVPARMKALVAAARSGDLATARTEQAALFPLFGALFIESNPIPAKAALAAIGLIADELRLPLCPMGAGPREQLHTALGQLGLLDG